MLDRNAGMLNPFKYGLFSWQLASHKLGRWLVPFAMIVALISNLVLFSRSSIYGATFLIQCAFYAAALGGLWTGAAALRIPQFFFMANLGVLTAWLRFARGERIASWNPSKRATALPELAAADALETRAPLQGYMP